MKQPCTPENHGGVAGAIVSGDSQSQMEVATEGRLSHLWICFLGDGGNV